MLKPVTGKCATTTRDISTAELKRYTKASLFITLKQMQASDVLPPGVAIIRAPGGSSVKLFDFRRAERNSQRDWIPPAKRLTKLEEEETVQRIPGNSKRGIPFVKAEVRHMADELLRERDVARTGLITSNLTQLNSVGIVLCASVLPFCYPEISPSNSVSF